MTAPRTLHALGSARSLVLDQPARGAGYRVNADAFLLARFARPRRSTERVCDLGAGVGAVGLTLVHEGFAAAATLIEVDRNCVALARQNATKNAIADRVLVVEGDVLEVARARRGEASLVVCNPPYIAPGRGRPPSVAARARARMGELQRFVEAARLIAGRRAKVSFVYPASELVTLVETLRRYGLEPKRLALVHPNTSSPARVALVETKAAKAGGLVIEPAIVERA